MKPSTLVCLPIGVFVDGRMLPIVALDANARRYFRALRLRTSVKSVSDENNADSGGSPNSLYETVAAAEPGEIGNGARPGVDPRTGPGILR